MSPSWTLKASRCRFMSAIRFGTPLVTCSSEIGHVAPEADGVPGPRVSAVVVAAGAGERGAEGGNYRRGKEGDQKSAHGRAS
jgi:hypothetical protein